MFSFDAYIMLTIPSATTRGSLCFRHGVIAALAGKTVNMALTNDYFDATICEACTQELETETPWNPLEH